MPATSWNPQTQRQIFRPDKIGPRGVY